MNQLSRTERFFVNATGWTLTLLALPIGAAFVGLVIDGLVLRR
jgi:hypothetical protein